MKKEIQSKGVTTGKIFLALVFSLAMLLIGSEAAFATHESTAELEPEWSPIGQIVDYTVTVTNYGPDTVDEVRIYKNTNYENFSCDEKTGWELNFINVLQACFYVRDPDTIPAGESENFTFSAKTSETPLDICDLRWRFETRDTNQTWRFIYDTTGIDSYPPIITKEVIGPQKGDCPPEEGDTCWVANHETEIEVHVTDFHNKTCRSQLDYCKYRINIDGVEGDWQDVEFDKPSINLDFTVIFEEDSVHELQIECADVAGNVETDSETFRVDSTPPETKKHFEGPQEIRDGVEWIDGVTTVVLDAVDPDPTGFECNIGVDKTLYLNVLAKDMGDTKEESCWNPTLCGKRGSITPPDTECVMRIQEGCKDLGRNTPDWVACVENGILQCFPGTSPMPWRVYNGTPIEKDEESCHILYYYSIDELGNTEEMEANCFFVDKKPPVVNKDNGKAIPDSGEPEFKTPENPDGAFHWLTTDMPVKFTCTDQQPHPSEGEQLCYKVSYDYPDWRYITDEYCDTSLTPDGYCCVPADPDNPFEFYFDEESMHNLEYYCIDAVEKKSEVHTQYYKVDDTPPSITKSVVGPQVGICPPESPSDKCYIMDDVTEIHVDTVDGGDICAVGVDKCYYWYYWDGTRYPASGVYTYREPIIFGEDSTHELHIKCIDRLGNEMPEDVETFLVDSTPPNTTKTYGDPYYLKDPFLDFPACEGPEYDKVCGWAQYISSKTPVKLTATDEKVGVDKIYWRNLLVTDEEAGKRICGHLTGKYHDDGFCNPEDYHNYVNTSIPFQEYTGEFYKPEDSCHVIEYYSVDKLGNVEPLKYQCVFVDNMPPEQTKEVGEPSIFIGGETCDDIIYDGDVPDGSGATITPDELMAELSPGEMISEHKEITTEDRPIGKLDVLFLFDLTGSMNDDIADVKSKANTIMNNISSIVADSAFGVGSFMDYNGYYNYCGYSTGYGSAGDYPWSLDEDITTSTGDIATAINGLSMGYGADGPESYARALYESQFVGWREGSRKVVIIFEDNSPHDCGLAGYGCASGTGTDPGRDGTAGTADDLPWSKVVSDLKAAGITVVAIEADSGECTGPWLKVTGETGGIFKPISDADDLPAEIADLIENVTAKISTLTLAPKPGFEEWFEWTPGAHHDVGGDETVGFDVNVTVPDGQPGGEYHMYLKVMGDGAILAVQELWINVTGPPAVCENQTDWWVSGITPITISCTDPDPHPVDNEKACFRISYDYPDWNYEKTGEYCAKFGGTMEGDECCVNVATASFTFNFLEDTMHNLEFYCEDYLGNKGDLDIEYFKVDNTPPTTTKTYHGPYYLDPDTGEEYIDTASWITLEADDTDDTCATGVNRTYWQNLLYTGEGEWYCESPENCVEWDPEDELDPEDWEIYTGPIYKNQESCHILAYYSDDGIGNKEDIKWQCFYVDKTPPVIEKEYLGPYFEEGGVEWISSETGIDITVYDPEPHPSGLKETDYRVTLVDDKYCRDQELCEEEAEGSGSWTLLPDDPFKISDESCHLIEVRATDNVEKSSYHKQCVFVDNTDPITNKTVGEPKSLWDGVDSVFYPEIKDLCWNGKGDQIECWKVTTMTPVNLNCKDPDPHPVDHETLCYMVDFDGEDFTQKYCEDDVNDEGWCCGDPAGTQFFFGEESEHNLKYYCIDALGNQGPVDEEKFKVEGTSFDIELNKKWNLISVPFVMLDDSIEEVFKDVEDKVESVWTYDGESDEWYVYTPGPAPDTLSEMHPGWGYWVMAKENALLKIGGSLFSPRKTPPGRHVVNGWNLIGYWGTEGETVYDGPDGDGISASCELYSLGENIFSKQFASLVSYWEPYNPYPWHTHSTYPNPPGLESYDPMDPGAGYWLWTIQEGEYVPPTTCGGLII